MHVHHILTVEQMYQVDELALAYVENSFKLMQNAAAAVCKEVLLELPANTTVGVLCGSGNNGGDGFVLASLLMSQGVPVVTVLCAPRKALNSLSGDARLAYKQFIDSSDDSALLMLGDLLSQTATTTNDAIQPMPQALANCHMIVDAVLGAGLSRPVSGQLATLFGAINQRKAEGTYMDAPMNATVE